MRFNVLVVYIEGGIVKHFSSDCLLFKDLADEIYMADNNGIVTKYSDKVIGYYGMKYILVDYVGEEDYIKEVGSKELNSYSEYLALQAQMQQKMLKNPKID